MKVAVVDYGASNLFSVERALVRVGARPERVRQAQALAQAEKIVLPGVGHFGALMEALARAGLVQALADAVARGAALLGICLGLQALYAGSEEAPAVAGLGWLRGTVRALPSRKRPHMGWNRIEILRPVPLLDGIPSGSWFYFAHSYAPPPEEHTVAVCDYGARFAAVVQKGSVAAVQFHPEKSGAVGLHLLRNFLGEAG